MIPLIPWTDKYLMKVLFGKGTSEDSRLHNTLQLNPTGAPDFKTTQRLLDPEQPPLRSTYEAYDLGFVYDFISSKHWKELPEKPRLSHIIELFEKFEEEYATHPQLALGSQINASIIHSFSHLITTALLVERWLQNEIKDCPLNYYTTKELYESRTNNSEDAKVKYSVFETNAFINYFAAAELDLAEWDSKFEIMTPVSFIPSSSKGKIIYPMETFWTWFRSESGHARWTDFADALGTTPAMLSKYRKTDPNKGLPSLPSYSQLRGFLRHRWPQRGLYVEMHQYLRIQFAYALARIMQAHAENCVGTITTHFCRVDQLGHFYLTRIEECRKWMQDFPLHPLFENKRSTP
jgi:hypothetical protein